MPRNAGAGGVGIGLAVEDWTGDARFFEYSQAVDPIAAGVTTSGPGPPLPRPVARPGSTRVVPLDLSDVLRTPYPATGPSLLARFLCIAAGDAVDLAPNATSALLYCLRGRGRTEVEGPGGAATIEWRPATS